MRKIRMLLKIVAFSLAIVLIVQILPLSTIATQLNSLTTETEIVSNEDLDSASQIVGEVESLRDEYTKHFRCEDGSYILATYNEPVHYRVNDEWEEIDNTIVSSSEGIFSKTSTDKDAKYSITKTSTPITFPENINDGKITITNGNNIISFGAKSNASSSKSVAKVSAPEKLTSTEILKVDATNQQKVDTETDENLALNVQSSALVYPDAFDNAYLEYEASSSMVKESIVVPEKSDSYRYEFSIDFGNYHPVVDDCGGIYIYETAESESAVMAIAPPYMFDAINETSDLVTMELVQNTTDYTLVIEANAEWINSDERKFPVVIDPTFILDLGRSAVHDIHVNEDNPNINYDLDYQLEVGRRLNNVFRTYIKYDLPDLPDCSVVTKANLKLIQNWSRSFSNTDVYLNVYQCTSDWNFDTIKWKNQPISDLSTVKPIDYTNFVEGMSAEYNLDITKIVKSWYESGDNYGLMLASSDESVKEKTSFYSSRNIVSNYPVVTIQYVNNIGVEDYWTYEGFSLGSSGTAYINTYNGALTYVHNDVSTNGLLAPLSISHVYNNDERSASGTFYNMNFGKGFKLNLIEKIEAVNSEVIANYPYKYIDADGTVHFFEQDSSGYHYEFDSSVRLTVNSSSYVMTFADGSSKTFNSSGYLTKTTDNNGNSITITYTSGRITKVTDGGGLSVSLVYNSNNTLHYITDSAGRKTYYSYNSNGQLSEITYPDATKTTYEYDSTSGLISKITAFDNMQATLTYKPSGNAYKVSSYSTYGNNTNHNLYDTISFEYRTNDTVISNTKDDVLVLAFDSTGRVINCVLNNKTISVNQYKNAANGKNGFNNLSFVSQNITPKPDLSDQMPITNYVARTSSDYTVAETSYDIVYNESTSLKYGFSEGASPGNYYRFSELPLEGNKTYSFSAYVNIENTLSSGSLYMKIEAKNSGGEIISTVYSERLTTTNNQWKRLSASINTPAEITSCKISYGIFEGVGIFYSESLYAEESDVISHYNFVDGSSFSSSWDNGPFYRWFGNFNNGISATTNSLDGSRAIMITGDPNSQRYVYQSLAINGKANDVLIYGGSAKALCSASGNNNGDSGRFFGIRFELSNSEGDLIQSSYVQFNKEAMDTFQTVMTSMVANQDYSYYTIELCYNYEINSAVFDDIFVYRSSYGTYYEYDSNGRIKTVSDDNGNEINYTHTGVDLTGVTVKANGTVTQSASYTYNNNHNLTSATGIDGVKTSYTYNIKGLPTSVTVSDASEQNITSTSYEYTSDNNYLKSVTDAAGSTTQYEYNTAKGLVTKIIDPNGNETVYEYDPNNDLMVSVSNPSSTVGNPTTEFEYNLSGQLMQISNVDIEYNLNYNSFGESTGVNLFDSPLSTNSYNNENQLSDTIFGNGYSVEYSYNEDNLLSKVEYNGELSYEYFYTSQNQVGRLVDHDNGVTWEYFYDMAGRLTDVESDNGKKIEYTYDSKNNPDNLTVKDGTSNLTDIDYTYDSLNRPSAVTVNSMTGQPSQSYVYDSLGRITGYENTTDSANPQNKITRSFSYLTNGGLQTNRIGSVSYTKTTSEGTSPYVAGYSYEYDANGNITHIYYNGELQNQYYYDSLNRLSREDRVSYNKTFVYTYDNCGDILSKSEYKYTSSTTLGTPTNTITYEYGDADNPNGLTSYNGKSITYDANGNPLTYRGYTMTWEKGRQLASMSKGGITTTFKYDASGIRTEKSQGNSKTEYTYVGEKLVSMKSGSITMNFAYGADGSPYSFTYNGTVYFYLLNLQGDVIGIYDASGKVIVRYTYDAWGKLITLNGSNGTIGLSNPLRYRGYVYDTDIGLYYLQSRYYDPETGRFINADSLLVAGDDYIQGTNMYTYCYNNPVMYVDYEGRSAAVATIALGAANSWNPAGPILMVAGVVMLGASAYVAFQAGQAIGEAISKPKTLSDTKAKIPSGGAYYLAYITNQGELAKKGKGMNFVQALASLGISGATNTLSKIYKYNKGKSSTAQRTLEHLGTGEWGIYTHDQSAAKALAVVLGNNDRPEYHGSGMYGHYHDSTHSFHIWYGGKIR